MDDPSLSLCYTPWSPPDFWPHWLPDQSESTTDPQPTTNHLHTLSKSPEFWVLAWGSCLNLSIIQLCGLAPNSSSLRGPHLLPPQAPCCFSHALNLPGAREVPLRLPGIMKQVCQHNTLAQQCDSSESPPPPQCSAPH